MKRILIIVTLWLLSSVAMQVSAQLINVNPDPNGEPWWVGGYELTPEEQARLDALPALVPTSKSLSTPLPYKVDNSDSIFFRPIFIQRGGSCAQASGVGYIFTFMVNRMRGLPADDDHPENQYPTHFTYNYLNRGSELNGSLHMTGWDIICDKGVPNVIEWGGMFGEPTKWMTGYNKYHSALENRVIIDAYTINCKGPEGVETLKHYIHNLAEGDTVKGGGIVGFSVSWGNVDFRKIPLTSPEEADKWIVKSWGGESGHAMTIVGYNDSIKYDFYGDWEYGAVKVANSWGINWSNGDSGFVYMPYRLLGQINAIKIKEAYAPKVTVKAKISHPSRNKVNIRAGIAEDASYNTPTITQNYSAYSLKRGGDLPMQGFNDEPIEIVLDVSDLLIGIIPAKRFFWK